MMSAIRLRAGRVLEQRFREEPRLSGRARPRTASIGPVRSSTARSTTTYAASELDVTLHNKLTAIERGVDLMRLIKKP
jgi:hypothetical protein